MKKSYESQLLLANHDRERVKESLSSFRSEKGALENDLQILEQVNFYLNSVVDKSITENKSFIEGLVNKCLYSVFGNFKIEICEKKNGPRIIRYFEVTNTDTGVSGGIETHGGGVFAVISFLFKFIISYKFKFYPFLLLDEPFSFVSEKYRQNLSLFIRELCKEFGYTIIIITHEPEFAEFADQSFTFYTGNGETKIKET